ncbi:MAG: hotdog domain-containing protein [Alphaproteobacteria bacterium]|jgi:fluoroacetyl-CoA thioesterase
MNSAAPSLGHVARFTAEVREADSAHTLGNPGVHVLATPKLTEFCELAAQQACREMGRETRHMRIDIRHLAATPVGDRIEIEAELVEMGEGRFVFSVRGRDSSRDIVSGRVERVA